MVHKFWLYTMKSRKELIISFVSFLSLLSCKSPDNSLYQFDPRNLIENEIRLSEIADDIKYIPLDNIYPLGLIHDNIEFINNSIYLSEKDIGILVFDKTGKIIRKIGSKGRGPGEYLYTFDFTVDEKTETIYVWDNNIIKVFSKSGKFERSFSLKEYGDFIYPVILLNSSLFAFFSVQFGNAEYKWITVDSLGNIIKKERRKTPAFTSNSNMGQGAYIFQNNITYWNSFNDTVFSIFPDLTEKPSFLFSPGEHRFPKSPVNIPIDEVTQYLSVGQVLETDLFLMIRYFYKGKKEFVLLEKENRISYLVNWEFNGSSGIINDLDGWPGFVPKNNFHENGRDYIAGLINPIQFKTLVSSDEFKNSVPKYPEKKKELEKLANSLKETDNPVLILVRLKK
jgi:hypothetical protein